MTDRINYLTVALKADTRADDVEPLINAILMLRDVIGVTPHVVDGSDWTAEQRARQKLREKLLTILNEI